MKIDKLSQFYNYTQLNKMRCDFEPCHYKEGKLIPNRRGGKDINNNLDNLPGALVVPPKGFLVIDIDSKTIPERLQKYYDHSLVTTTAKGYHLWVKTKKEFKSNGKELDGIHIDFCCPKTSKKKGRGVFAPGSAKYSEGDVTHWIEDSSKPVRPLLKEDEDFLLELCWGKPATSNSKSPKLHASGEVPEGQRHMTLNNAGMTLVGRGVCKESRDMVLDMINEGFCGAYKSADEMQHVKNSIDAFAAENDFKCPFRITLNSKEDGVHSTIRKCFETAEWDFRVNIRGDTMEGKKGAEDWTLKDPTTWRALVTTDCQDSVMHSLDIKIQKDKKGQFEKLIVKHPVFKYPEIDIKNCLKRWQIENPYDPFREYLESEPVQEIVKELRDPREFKIWEVLGEIVQFNKPMFIQENFSELPAKYNRWALFMALYPALYNTFRPGTNFGESVLFIGPEGCFKSTLIKACLPRDLQEAHYKSVSFRLKDEDLIRTMRGSIISEFEEMIGFHDDEERTKGILGRLVDNYRKLWEESVLPYPRLNGILLTSNNPTPLRMSQDAQRRYAPFYIYPNQDITQRGIEERKTASGFADYLEEWSDKYRDRIWAELYWLFKKGMKPGLPHEFNKLREQAVKKACGLDEFESEVRKVFTDALSDEEEKLTFKIIYENLPNYRRGRKKDNIIKSVFKELGGSGETSRSREGVYFDLQELSADKTEVKSHEQFKDWT